MEACIPKHVKWELWERLKNKINAIINIDDINCISYPVEWYFLFYFFISFQRVNVVINNEGMYSKACKIPFENF